jgi:hypothetical protein
MVAAIGEIETSVGPYYCRSSVETLKVGDRSASSAPTRVATHLTHIVLAMRDSICSKTQLGQEFTLIISYDGN